MKTKALLLGMLLLICSFPQIAAKKTSVQKSNEEVSNIHIKSLWEFSSTKGNRPEEKDIRNGFAYYDGELYMASRRAESQVVIYDAATGEPKMENGKIAQLPKSDVISMTYAGGDVYVDRNGAIYCVASDNRNIIKWESRTATTSSIYTTLPEGNFEGGFWGFDMIIDENGDGCIVGISQATFKLCYIPITNNEPGTAKEMWLLDDFEPGSVTRAFLVDKKTLWINGVGSDPVYIELDDNLNIKTQRAFAPENVNKGVAGIAQFDYKGLTYLVVAANNHAVEQIAPTHSALVFEFNPVDMSYKKVGDYLPKEGLGSVTDYSHMVVPVVRVEENEVYIYLMGGTNGIAAFKFYDSSEPIEPDIYYTKNAITKRIGDAPFVNPLTSESDGTVSYNSSATHVATVDSEGLVTILAEGKTEITATVAATETFLEATATYILTVEGTPTGPIVDLLWEYSVNNNNMGELADFRNGFDYYEGELFFASRRDENTQVVIYDAETGKIKMNGGSVAQLPSSPDLNMKWAGGDVAFDDNGAIYAIASNSENIIKWQSKEDTSPSIFTTLPAKDIWALDAKIDKDGNGCIVSASQATGRIYYVPVTANVPGQAVTLKIKEDLGYTPRTFIVDTKTFWVDGNANRPTRVVLNDDLSIQSENELKVNDISAGVNGIAEFELKGRTFIVVAANNHAPYEIPNHSALIYELDIPTFSVSKITGYFPEEGLGGETDGSHLVAPVVRIEGDEAYIYLLGGCNGIAAYKFMVYGDVGISKEDIQSKAVIYRTHEGVEMKFEGKADIEIFRIDGVLVERTVAFDTYSKALDKGLYIVRINGVSYKFMK